MIVLEEQMYTETQRDWKTMLLDINTFFVVAV